MQSQPDRLRVASLILNEKGELLIVRIKDRDIWTSLGGGIKEGESESEAVIREIKEEVGLDAYDTEKYIETPIERAAGTEDKTVKVLFYLVKVNGEIRLDPEEKIAEYKWLSVKNFQEMGEAIASGLREYAIPKLIAEGFMR